MAELKQMYHTPDGQAFESKQEAMDHMRKPKIRGALLVVTNNNSELADWLLDKQEFLTSTFDIGTIRRVTKSERNKLNKSLDYIANDEELSKNPKLAFLVEHKETIVEVFRWPTVKRMNDEEKEVVMMRSIENATDGNLELANWIVANKDRILEAYKAGIPKRTVAPEAQAALAEYRAKMAAKKAAKEAAEAAGVEYVDEEDIADDASEGTEE